MAYKQLCPQLCKTNEFSLSNSKTAVNIYLHGWFACLREGRGVGLSREEGAAALCMHSKRPLVRSFTSLESTDTKQNSCDVCGGQRDFFSSQLPSHILSL